MSKRFEHGLVLGKFLPPHAGHLHLIALAQALAKEVTVVIDRHAADVLAPQVRQAWLAHLAAPARVVVLSEDLPQSPDACDRFWPRWRQALQDALGRPCDAVFASEDYGPALAHHLGACFVPVDPQRQGLRISGTAIRRDPWRYFAVLPPLVRAHFVHKIVIFGPESVGKSTLAARLAEHYATLWVPEYARTLLSAQGGQCAPADLPAIMAGQNAAEASLAQYANGLLFCDTDALATVLWSRELFADHQPELAAQLVQHVGEQRYALTLLLRDDVPYVADPVRYRPDSRSAFFAASAAILQHYQRPYIVISGSWEQRWQLACQAVDRLIAASGWTWPPPATPWSCAAEKTTSAGHTGEDLAKTLSYSPGETRGDEG